MSADKFKTVKEAIEIAQTSASKLFSTVSPSDSNDISACLNNALLAISRSNNEPSSEKELAQLTISLIRVCCVIKILALSPDLAQINFRGVSLNSIIKYLKDTAKALKTAEKFAMMSQDDDSKKLSFIVDSFATTEGCATEFSKILRLYNEKETTIEFSNALKITCSAIKCSASKVASNYAWGYDCICEEN